MKTVEQEYRPIQERFTVVSKVRKVVSGYKRNLTAREVEEAYMEVGIIITE
jgi:hypothetical protein